MGRNKSRYIDKADKKKLKDKSTVVSTIGHDGPQGLGTFRKADYSSISAKDRPNRHNNPRTGLDTRVQSKTSNNSNWLHAVGFVVLAAIVICGRTAAWPMRARLGGATFWTSPRSKRRVYASSNSPGHTRRFLETSPT